MVTRKSLILLTGVALTLFAISGIIGNHQHGALYVIANVAWWSFVLCALYLVVASAATILRRRSRLNRS